jgi:hypothetical protein
VMSDHVVGAHNDLHSHQGARNGEHPGRSRDPIIKVHDIAWLEFEKPDLARAEAFSRTRAGLPPDLICRRRCAVATRTTGACG